MRTRRVRLNMQRSFGGLPRVLPRDAERHVFVESYLNVRQRQRFGAFAGAKPLAATAFASWTAAHGLPTWASIAAIGALCLLSR
jgi:hypothetical protein